MIDIFIFSHTNKSVTLSESHTHTHTHTVMYIHTHSLINTQSSISSPSGPIRRSGLWSLPLDSLGLFWQLVRNTKGWGGSKSRGRVKVKICVCLCMFVCVKKKGFRVRLGTVTSKRGRRAVQPLRSKGGGSLRGLCFSLVYEVLTVVFY